MSLDDLGNLGEFLAAVAVVVSLVYLAVQIRQNTQAVKINTFQALGSARSEFVGSVASNPEVSKLIFAGMRDWQALQEDERIRFTFLIFQLFVAFENQAFLFGQGVLPKDQYRQTRAYLRWWLQWPGVRTLWEANIAPWSDDLTGLVNEELRAIRSDDRAAQQAAEADGRTAQRDRGPV